MFAPLPVTEQIDELRVKARDAEEETEVLEEYLVQRWTELPHPVGGPLPSGDGAIAKCYANMDKRCKTMASRRRNQSRTGEKCICLRGAYADAYAILRQTCAEAT